MIYLSTAETIFTAERPRLVRLCARLSGNWDTAEDLAQETLLRAWYHVERLPEAGQAAPWLSGIARNVCLEWSRRHYREQRQLVPPASATTPDGGTATDQLPDDFDLEFELEREELVTLLDQALALLPAETRAVLVQKYVEESSYAEIAARLGESENAVAVRAHRGKLAFQRVLANELRVEAMALGLLHGEHHTWTETRIWCPCCGDRRLLGRFQKSTLAGAFELRCPTCNDGAVATKADLSVSFFAELLGDVKTYKPAFSRLLTTIGNYCRQALESQVVSCLVCGRETAMWLGKRNDLGSEDRDKYEVRIVCGTCHWETNYALESFALILPEAKQFWCAHPRFRILPTREVEVNGTPALMTCVRSMTDSAGLNVIFVRDTFELVGVHPAHAS